MTAAEGQQYRGADKLVCMEIYATLARRYGRLLLAAKDPKPGYSLQDKTNHHQSDRTRHTARNVCRNGSDEEKQSDEMSH